MTRRFLTAALILCAPIFAQYKTEAAGALPPEAAPFQSVLAKDGIKILKPDGSVLCEIWLVAKEPTGGTTESGASMTGVPHGALMGVISYPSRSSDRRGQTIKPGLYTLRYSLYPVNGDHQGVSPQRDFFVLSIAAQDTDPAAKPNFDALMTMSRKASGTPHPLTLSAWKGEADAKPGVVAEGETDQVLHTKIGAMPVFIIVVGKVEA